MAVDLLPDGPDPATDSPAVFSQKAAASVLAQKVMVQQFNDHLALFNASLAGGAYALPYVFDSATADADPGLGKLRLSSATQNAATVMRLDVQAGGQDVSSILDTFDVSTSDVKGSIRLVKTGDPSKWLIFDVVARAAPSGYRNLTVVNRGGSSANPFTNGDGLLLFFQRNGDIGTAFSGLMRMTNDPIIINSQTALLSLPNVFDSRCDRYQIELAEIRPTTSAVLILRFFSGGAVQTTGYLGTLTETQSTAGPATASWITIGNIIGASGASFTLDIRAANSSSVTLKTVGIRGGYRDSTGYYFARNADAFFTGEAITGFELSFISGTIARAKVNVFGYKNSIQS